MPQAAKTINRVLGRLDMHVTRRSRTVRARRVALLNAHCVRQLVDVGANDGAYARELREAEYTGRIVSCEPVTEVFSRLERAASADPAWTVRRLALGAQPGELELSVAQYSVFSSALPVKAEMVAVDPRSAAVRTETVPMTTLDALVAAECDAGPLAVKLDVQGFEAAILDGGPETIARAVLLELELSPLPLYEGETPMIEMLQRTREAGLVLALAENVSSDGRTGRALQVNGIFVRP